jgi:hypothetical protein
MTASLPTLLLALAYLLLRGAWRAFARGDPPEAKPEAKAPLASARGGFGLGAAIQQAVALELRELERRFLASPASESQSLNSVVPASLTAC